MSQGKNTVRTVCRFCRKEFDSYGMKKVCDECDRNMEEEFKRIKAYIIEYPDATLAEICESLKVTSALVKYYLKEERLIIKNSKANYFLKCEICGKPISSGRYCMQCELVAPRADMKQLTAPSKEEMEMDHVIAKYHIGRHIRKK